MLMEAMEIWKEALGPRHHHVATALNNIGELLRAQARPLSSDEWRMCDGLQRPGKPYQNVHNDPQGVRNVALT